MEIDIGGYNFRSWLIIHSVTELGDMDTILKAHPEGKKTWDVRLTIDGVELPLDKTIDQIEKNLDEHIVKKARELISSKMGEIENEIDELAENVREQVEEMRNKMTQMFNATMNKILPQK